MTHHLILRVVVKLLIAAIVTFALYVQFHGDYSPGGGFQAGAIMAAGFIVYAIVFGMDHVKEVCPEWAVHKMMGLGVLIFAGCGVVSMFLGQEFLAYNAFTPEKTTTGQHAGLLIVEFGVGVTVTGVLISIFYAFASRPPTLKDSDW
ncbi:MAG: Na(+)/H(+) antiporter subunit B [Pseudomonadota bacterium]